MQAINQREILVLHDRRVLEAAMAKLPEIAAAASTDPDRARRDLDRVVEDLASLVGRNPDLDQSLRDYRSSDPAGAAPTTYAPALLQLVQQTIAVV